MNRKGATFGQWTEGILFSMLIILALGTLTVSIYQQYGKNNDLTFGIGANDTISKFIGYQDSLQTSTSEGEAVTSTTGVSTTTLWGIIRTGATITWTFLSGAYIENLTDLMNLPAYVGLVFRLVYLLSIGFILVKILTKVEP